MIKSVGIDFAGTGEHKVRCLDERSQMCDGFSFQTAPDGLAKLEERIFGDGSNPVIVFEPLPRASQRVTKQLIVKCPFAALRGP